MDTPIRLGDIAKNDDRRIIHNPDFKIKSLLVKIPKKLNKLIGNKKNIPVNVLIINGNIDWENIPE